MKSQDTEIERLSAIVNRHEVVVNSNNRRWKPEVLESGQYHNYKIKNTICAHCLKQGLLPLNYSYRNGTE